MQTIVTNPPDWINLRGAADVDEDDLRALAGIVNEDMENLRKLSMIQPTNVRVNSIYMKVQNIFFIIKQRL